MSDLHVEFERKHPVEDRFRVPVTDADVIVLAGDIGVGFKEEKKFCEQTAQEHGKPVIFVLGNHSFYGGGNVDRIRGRWNQYMKSEERNENVYYLDEGKAYSFEGKDGDKVNFIGGIFWTDFNNYNEQDMMVARNLMNDYHNCFMSKRDSEGGNVSVFDSFNKIKQNVYKFTPRRSVDEHYKTKEWMNHMLSEWKDQTNVVITHHLPSVMSTDAQYRGHKLNSAYYSNLEEWIMDRDIALWIHGHTHGSNNYYIEEEGFDKRTKVVCNPQGYYPQDLNQRFDPGLVIEV